MEDECIDIIRAGLAQGNVEASISSVCRNYFPVAKKSQWVYSEWIRRKGSGHENLDDFILAHLKAWCRFVVNATSQVRIAKHIDPIQLKRKLFVTWHSPSYPLCIDWLTEHGVLILLARRAPWLQRVADAGCAFYFRDSNLLSLARTFRSGRPILAMMDHCYAGTRACRSSFLSFNVSSPIGLYELANRFGYQVEFVNISEGAVNFTPTFTSKLNPPEQARRVDVLIEDEVNRKPADWLLWATLPSRCVDGSLD